MYTGVFLLWKREENDDIIYVARNFLGGREFNYGTRYYCSS